VPDSVSLLERPEHEGADADVEAFESEAAA